MTRRGTRLRQRRRAVMLLPVPAMFALVVGALAFAGDGGTSGDVRLDTTPAAPAPDVVDTAPPTSVGPAAPADDAAPRPPSPASGAAPAGGHTSGPRSTAARSSSPTADDAKATATAPADHAAEGEARPRGTTACNVVGTGSVTFAVGSNEEYARGNTCDYEATEPGGYTSQGTEWEMRITRGGEQWTISPFNGAKACEPTGFFQAGDYVQITVRAGSQVAAGPRYRCA